MIILSRCNHRCSFVCIQSFSEVLNKLNWQESNEADCLFLSGTLMCLPDFHVSPSNSNWAISDTSLSTQSTKQIHHWQFKSLWWTDVNSGFKDGHRNYWHKLQSPLRESVSPHFMSRLVSYLNVRLLKICAQVWRAISFNRVTGKIREIWISFELFHFCEATRSLNMITALHPNFGRCVNNRCSLCPHHMFQG